MARSKGTGSVYPWRGAYAYQVAAGYTPSGGRRRITRSGYATKKAAEHALAKQLREIAATGVPAGQAITVKRWADQWLEQREHHVRPTTLTADRSAIRQHIIPTIGARRLDHLTPGDVRAVHQHATSDGRSTSTALRAHAVLMTMLKAARAEGHTVPDTVSAVRRPARAITDRDAIPLPDALALLQAAQDDPHAARWVAALLQGMRQAECLGLTWACVDLDRGTVDVSWQLQPLPYADRAAGTFRVPDAYDTRHLTGAYHLTRPKTARGQRIVPLVPWMTAALTAWRELAPPNPWGLVWTEPGPRPTRAATDEHAWRQLQQTAGVHHSAGRAYHLHEARHTTATLLLEAGVDEHTVTAILGHSTIATSRGYQHVNQELARAAMDALAARLQLEPGSGGMPAGDGL